MSQCSIRFAEFSDIEDIMTYIDNYWKKGHILAKDRDLFEWQFRNDNRLNMVLGVDEEGRIQGTLGYIPYDNAARNIALIIWSANSSQGFLGINLLLFLLENVKPENAFSIGINKRTTENIYKYLGFHVDKSKQWYRLQPIEEYRIAKINDKKIPEINRKSNLHVVKAKDFKDFSDSVSEKVFSKDNSPYKSREYIKRRYFDHPKYNYLVYKIVDSTEIANSAIVLRIQECNGSKALRVVDFLGDAEEIYNVTSDIDKIALEYEAEYTDMYEYGLSDIELRKAGWIQVGESANIIPNYFAPYEPSNIDVYICTQKDNIIMFRGDADQDRPN